VLHFIVSISGILIMSAAAWLFSWYKHSADKNASRVKKHWRNADMAGRGLMKSNSGSSWALRYWLAC